MSAIEHTTHSFLLYFISFPIIISCSSNCQLHMLQPLFVIVRYYFIDVTMVRLRLRMPSSLRQISGCWCSYFVMRLRMPSSLRQISGCWCSCAAISLFYSIFDSLLCWVYDVVICCLCLYLY